MAKITDTDPQNLIADAKNEFTNIQGSFITDDAACGQVVLNQRGKKNDAIPHKLEDINLSEIYTLTHEKEKFLQADLSNKLNKKQRFMIFTTEYNLEQMCKAFFWVMGGTFDVSPDLFYQIYIIHAPVVNASNSNIFPLVIIWLMENLKICTPEFSGTF